jgi:hypothetical protein
LDVTPRPDPNPILDPSDPDPKESIVAFDVLALFISVFLGLAAVFLHLFPKLDKDELRSTYQRWSCYFAVIAFVLFAFRLEAHGFHWLDWLSVTLLAICLVAAAVRWHYSNYDPHHLYDKLGFPIYACLLVVAVRIVIAAMDWLFTGTDDGLTMSIIVMRVICVLTLAIAAGIAWYGHNEWELAVEITGIVGFVLMAALSYFMFFRIDILTI